MNVTDKNHYNPCFWTAYWNPEYLDKKRSHIKATDARNQVVSSLNLKSNKILRLKTKNVFYDKGAGIATITQENVLDYCKREIPDEHDQLEKYYLENPSELTLDFENHFTLFEGHYKPSLEYAIHNQNIDSIQHKTILSFFIFIQLIRNHNHLSDAVRVFNLNNKAKFELFISLKHTLSSTEGLMNLLLPFIFSKWTLYKSTEGKFPLSDNPVLVRTFNIQLPLAPDLLLEVNLNKKVSENDICTLKDTISFLKYREFKKRSIKNSSREIVFARDDLLEKWQNSRTYKNHLKEI